jgi:hypothetical protein
VIDLQPSASTGEDAGPLKRNEQTIGDAGSWTGSQDASRGADLIDLLRPYAALRSFALLDAARNPAIPQMLRSARADHEPLYARVRETDYRAVAPQLVSFSDDPSRFRTLVSAAWGRSWGIYLLSGSSLPELLQHFRRLLMARLPDGRKVYFRFYDPRVMRVYLPTCTAEEARTVFGPVSEYLVEGDRGMTAHCFTATNGVVAQRELLVDPLRIISGVGAASVGGTP